MGNSMGKKCPRCGTEITDSNSPYCPKCLIIVNPAILDKTKKSSKSSFDDILEYFDSDIPNQSGKDLLLHIQIRPEDAISGFDREIEFTHTEPCISCTCPHCHGSGKLGEKPSILFGKTILACAKCSGWGKILEGVCKECQGTGTFSVKRTVPMHIPAGIKNGTRVRIEGMGDAGGYRGKNGDLFIEVHIL